MIGVVDYQAGNLGSVQNALKFLGYDFTLLRKPRDFDRVQKIILPGVGHFGSAVLSLKEKGIFDLLRQWIFEKKPFLGICLGLQLLFCGSKEAPDVEGLGIFPGILSRFQSQKVPNIGWSRIEWKKDSPLQEGLGANPWFYFIHSYYVPLDNGLPVLATATYGTEYVAVISDNQVVGVQFHPERSGQQGLRFLKNWAEL